MKPWSVHKVPAGKVIKSKKPAKWKYMFKALRIWLREKRFRESYFAVAASAFILFSLGTFDYFSNYLYVVKINEREVGAVHDAREIEAFVVDLTNRCEELYGLNIEIGDVIELVREYRPDDEPESDGVQQAIRQRMTFLAEAFMITVDGTPLVPVNSEQDLDIVVSLLKQAYSNEDYRSKQIDAIIVEDLGLEVCLVDPDRVYEPEKVVALMVNDDLAGTASGSGSVELASRYSRESRQAYSDDYISSLSPFSGNGFYEYESDHINDDSTIEVSSVRVKTVEETVVVENIPFATEYVYDEDMWIVQSEVLDPGEEGKLELIYHITRLNGVETERVKISETVLKEPVTQIEALGTAQVPSVGTGQFIWPVEGGGEVTPGRGFSAWHTGIDIHGDLGTNILAADSGVVWFSGRGGSQGNYLVIYHGQYWTMYLHNEVNLAHKGDAVEQGEVIARLGSTGRSTGPHLHFEVRRDDGTGEWHTYYQHKPIDPLKFFSP